MLENISRVCHKILVIFLQAVGNKIFYKFFTQILNVTNMSAYSGSHYSVNLIVSGVHLWTVAGP